jgi:hypothetical protein
MFVNMKYLKACRNCLKGIPISLTGDILCKYKGVVSTDYVCIRHKFIPELKTYREMDYKCIDCANFCIKPSSYDQTSDLTIGLCKLFSVRHFDGTQRKACSKFLMKSEIRAQQSEVKEKELFKKDSINAMQFTGKSRYLQY